MSHLQVFKNRIANVLTNDSILGSLRRTLSFANPVGLDSKLYSSKLNDYINEIQKANSKERLINRLEQLRIFIGMYMPNKSITDQLSNIEDDLREYHGGRRRKSMRKSRRSRR